MPPAFTKNFLLSIREDAIAPGISEHTSVRADSSKGLLERPPSANSVTTTKSKLPMVV